jgi:hypothetical protein
MDHYVPLYKSLEYKKCVAILPNVISSGFTVNRLEKPRAFNAKYNFK